MPLNGDDRLLFVRFTPSFVADVFFPAWFSAQIFFIQFNNAVELALGGHPFSNGGTDFPGGGLGNADPAGQING